MEQVGSLHPALHQHLGLAIVNHAHRDGAASYLSRAGSMAKSSTLMPCSIANQDGYHQTLIGRLQHVKFWGGCDRQGKWPPPLSDGDELGKVPDGSHWVTRTGERAQISVSAFCPCSITGAGAWLITSSVITCLLQTALLVYSQHSNQPPHLLIEQLLVHSVLRHTACGTPHGRERGWI